MTLPLDRITKELGQVSTSVRTRGGKWIPLIAGIYAEQIAGWLGDMPCSWDLRGKLLYPVRSDSADFDLVPIDPTPEPVISDEEVRELIIAATDELEIQMGAACPRRATAEIYMSAVIPVILTKLAPSRPALSEASANTRVKQLAADMAVMALRLEDEIGVNTLAERFETVLIDFACAEARPYLERALKAERAILAAGPVVPQPKEDWTGNKCPRCKGHGIVCDDTATTGERACPACGGTGDEYGPVVPVGKQKPVGGDPAVDRQTDEWVICKRGLYYRPNAQGYTTDIAHAGRFTNARANAEVEEDPELVTAHRAPPTPQKPSDYVLALREACGPFVREAKRIHAAESADTINDNVELWQCGHSNIARTRITYGDLRKLVAILSRDVTP